MADVFPSRVQQETFVTRHDIKLQLYCKTSLVPKCIVVLTHGVQSHAAFEWMSYPVQLGGQMRVESGSEKSWLSKLADELPADVWAYDIQGHGRSGGKRGNVRVFEDYSCDLLEIVSYIQGKATAAGRGSIPCYLMGISMGGCITCRAVEILGLALLQPGDASADKAIGRILENRDRFIFRGEYPVPKLEPQVDGVILLAPMLSLEKLKKRTSHKLMMPFAGIVSRYLPGLKVGAVAPNEKFPYVDQQKKIDKLAITGKTPARLCAQALRAVDAVNQSAAALGRHTEVGTFMLRIYHSENDGMCDPDGSKTFILKPPLKDKKLFLLDKSATLSDSEFLECIRLDMWHYLTLEPATATLREHVTNQIKCHLDRTSRGNVPVVKEANLDLTNVDDEIQAARAAEQNAMDLDDFGGEDTDFDVPYNEPSSDEE